jgi:iron complex outermembrane recepter protein
VAAGQIPAANAQAAITAGVATQMASAAVRTTIANTTAQVTPAFALATLPKYQIKEFKPERVKSFEIGYKSLIAKKLFVDVVYYHSVYQNFIGQSVVLVPTAPANVGLPIESGLSSASTRVAYQFPANTSEDVTVSGFALGLDYTVAPGYAIAANFSQNTMDKFTPTLELPYGNFNTPKNRYNVSFSKKIGSGKNFGFSVNFKHQDAFPWQTGWNVPTTATVQFYTNTIVPVVNNFDAQVSYKLSGMKSILKIGGTNIGGKPYFQAYGSPSIGSTYYVSLTFDELLNK